MMIGVFGTLIFSIFALAALRCWMIWRGFRGHWPGRFAANILLQVSAVWLLFAALLNESAWFLLSLLPELGFLFFAALWLPWREFLFSVLVYALPTSAAIAALAVLVMHGRHVVMVFGIALIVTSLTIGDRISKSLMCATALNLGVPEIKRNSLRYSLANAPREFQFVLHGQLNVEEQTFGWSYRERDWYPLPKSVLVGVEHNTITRCK